MSHLEELWVIVEGHFPCHHSLKSSLHRFTLKRQPATEHEIKQNTSTKAVNLDPLRLFTQDFRSYIAGKSLGLAHRFLIGHERSNPKVC